MITFLQIAGGLLLLFLGGEFLVRGAVALAKNLGVSTFVIGLTVVAYGTSSPEMLISVQAVLDGYPDIATGNVIGSNISNILCVLGITALVYPMAIDRKNNLNDTIFVMAISLLFFVVCLFGFLSIYSGFLFLSLLIIYTVNLIIKSKNKKEEINSDVPEANHNIAIAILLCLVGLGLLIFGSNILVKGAVTLAKIAGVSEAIIGVTLVAFGGSVPELATSVLAAIRKNSDIALGNILGSNLFNILGIMGISSLVKDIPANADFVKFDLPVMCLSMAIMLFVVYKKPYLSRTMGGFFFISYVGYISFQFI